MAAASQEELFRQMMENVSKIKSNLQKNQKPNEFDEPKYNFRFLGLNDMAISQIESIFSQVKFVILCGPKERAKKIAFKLQKSLRLPGIGQIGESGRFFSP